MDCCVDTEDCCPKFHCSIDIGHGYISGNSRPLRGDELEPVTTYFHNAVHVNKSINSSHIAVSFNDKSITFEELSTYSTIIANKLKQTVQIDHTTINKTKDVIFAICLTPSEKVIPVIFSVLKTGAAYLPLNPEYPEEMIFRFIKKFEPKLIIKEKNCPILFTPDAISPLKCEILLVEDLWEETVKEWAKTKSAARSKTGGGGIFRRRRSSAPYPALPAIYPVIEELAPTSKERVALVLPTIKIMSNNPRAVRISHLNIMNRLCWTWNELPYIRNATCCLTEPISQVQSIFQIFAPLLKGVPVHLQAKKDTKVFETYLKFISGKKITLICLNPAHFHEFMADCSKMKPNVLKKDLKSLKYIICQGTLLSKDDVSKFLKVLPKIRLFTLYGHPELTGDMICERYKNAFDLDRKTLLGKLLVRNTVQNTRIYVLDEDLNTVNEGEQGQLCISGNCVALGYVDNEIDKGNFVLNPHDDDPVHKNLFCTGDFGRLIRCADSSVRVRIEGREDELIHNQDYDFSLADVKACLKKADDVEDVNVLVIPHGKFEESIVAFVVMKKDVVLANKTDGDYLYVQFMLDMQIRNMLPDFMVPEIRLLETIPVVETGRADASALMQQYNAGKKTTFADWLTLPFIGSDADKVDAAKVLLEGLYKYCSIPVEISAASMNKSAYDLGCDSNSTVSTILYINASGYPITLNDFLEHSKLYQLVELMVEKRVLRQKKIQKGEKVRKSYEDLTIDCSFTSQGLEEKHKAEAIKMLAACYTQKGSLEKYNLIPPEEYIAFLNDSWEILMKRKLSICCIRKLDFGMAGVALVIDFFEGLEEIQAKGNVNKIFQFQAEIKSQFVGEMPLEYNNTMQCFMLGTSPVLSTKENVQVVTLMLSALKQTADVKNYANIYLITPNQFVEDMCHYMMRFAILDEYSAREFISHEKKPFRLAPRTVGVTALLLNVHLGANKTTDPNDPGVSVFLGKKKRKRKSTKLSVSQLTSDRILR